MFNDVQDPGDIIFSFNPQLAFLFCSLVVLPRFAEGRIYHDISKCTLRMILSDLNIHNYPNMFSLLLRILVWNTILASEFEVTADQAY